MFHRTEGVPSNKMLDANIHVGLYIQMAILGYHSQHHNWNMPFRVIFAGQTPFRSANETWCDTPLRVHFRCWWTWVGSTFMYKWTPPPPPPPQCTSMSPMKILWQTSFNSLVTFICLSIVSKLLLAKQTDGKINLKKDRLNNSESTRHVCDFNYPYIHCTWFVLLCTGMVLWARKI